MASSIAGSKGSTSRPRGKPDPAGGVRRARVAQLLVTQGLLALLLLVLAFMARNDPPTLALVLWTLLVPAGFAYVYGTAYQRHERALKEGRWTQEWAKKEDARGYSSLGAVFALWIVGVLAILVLL